MLEHLADHDRLGPWMEPYPDPAWQLIAAGYDPTREAQIEACFAISNGLLGSRASRSVSRGPTWVTYQHHLTWASWERTYVAGLYDTSNVLPPVSGLVPAPDWLRARIWVNDNLVLLRSGELRNYHRTLDLRHGRNSPSRMPAHVASLSDGTRLLVTRRRRRGSLLARSA
jgi:trehalose/maltose hydrolase-like predicted phosphorylase